MLRILSKKMKRKSKKGVSWNQSGRNRKLIGKATADSLEITEALKEPEKKTGEKVLRGFNSVESCPNCNKPIIKGQSLEISRHEFMNPYEFTDKALLEELIIRIKKGCIEIKKTKNDWVLEEECRWDLSRGLQKREKDWGNSKGRKGYRKLFGFYSRISCYSGKSKKISRTR